MPTATLVTNHDELEEILALQVLNLKQNIDGDEMKSQGFVTISHTIDVLEKMNSIAPSVLVKEGNQIAGYALTMMKECRILVPGLDPMFESFDALEWKGKKLKEYRFYVMGQICIAKEFRGQGIFEQLYLHHKKIFSPVYDFIITEVATRNTRSLRAHEKVGFKTIHTYTDELDTWAVVIWDWK
ncbi:MAG: GNAT family N-acetyltransferase [Bacteroidetes bacterium]|nr:MAG: GNAT family N-acetyltransferase [Bacteroidota bacterium]